MLTQFPRFNRRAALLLAGICAVIALPAQKHSFSFFPLNNPAFSQQSLLGRAGTHFFLMDQEHSNGLSLYIFDTATGSGISKNYPFPKPISMQLNERSIVFISAQPAKSGSSFHLLELDANGEAIRTKVGPLPMLKGRVKLATSLDKKHLLFYQLSKVASDSSIISGLMLGADWETKKQLQYSFKYNADLDADPEIFLDNNGNTHVLVTDKFTNYRISSDLTVNTIPFMQEQMVSETFNFAKVKLKSLQVFQNTECDCMQAEGIYVDGLDKTNRGIYSLAFPPDRKNELSPRFILFNEEMIRNLRLGFSATDELIQKSLELQDIFFDDNGSVAVMRLAAGIPQKLLNHDPALDAFTRALSISRGADLQTPVVSTATRLPRTPGAPPPTAPRTIPQPDKYVNASPDLAGSAVRRSPLSSRASARNSPKLIFMKLEKDRGIQWYGSRPLDIFNYNFDTYNRSFIINDENGVITLLLYQADAADEPYPVLVTFQAGKQFVEKIPEKKLLFSPLQFLAQGQYAALYQNTETGLGGLLLIRNNE